MPSHFRYLSPRFADAFIRRGEVLFRALSYFRDYEDIGVRADAYEGTLVHRPKGGLKLFNSTTGEVVSTPHTFEASVNEDDIFIYCLSTELSQTLARQFNTTVCIEILDLPRFLGRIRNALALRRRVQVKQLVHGSVKYYAEHEPPIVDWALPERIALRKLESFHWQHEYRIAFPLNNAFAVENVKVNLVPLDTRRVLRLDAHPNMLLRLGDISKLCRVHSL